MKKQDEKKELAFALKYRPKSFDEFLGNKAVVEGIQQTLKKGNQHCFLITGPTGCGKTTLARIIGKELGCEETQFVEINTANNRGIDTIREVIESAAYEPLMGGVKVYLFDEAHRVTGDASDAMLKFLEDTPPHVYIILATTLPEKLSDTVKNRCIVWAVNSLGEETLSNLLDKVAKEEEQPLHAGVRDAIVAVADGCAREALQILNQIIYISDEVTQMQIIADCQGSDIQISAVCRLIYKKAAWADLVRALLSFEMDMEIARMSVMGWFAKVLMNPKMPKFEQDRISRIMNIFQHPIFANRKSGFILYCYQALEV